MKITHRILAVVAITLLLTSCVSGNVENKRAAGEPGRKTYQLRIDDRNPLAPDEFWINVTREEWYRCGMQEQYPGCRK